MSKVPKSRLIETPGSKSDGVHVSSYVGSLNFDTLLGSTTTLLALDVPEGLCPCLSVL